MQHIPVFHHQGERKRRFVHTMFSQIVPHYDLLNRLLTLGMDLKWRKRLAISLRLQPGDQVLDLASGTGDVIRSIKRHQPDCLVVGADPVPAMLDRARAKLPQVRAICCEGESLPFPEGIFQAVTVAFGVRNFSYLESGLAEIYRVLAPAGQLRILEFALPRYGRLRRFFHWYLMRILPRLGALLSRGYAYQYLPESIQQFPDPADFASLLASGGFVSIETERFMGGTVWLYKGQKGDESKI